VIQLEASVLDMTNSIQTLQAKVDSATLVRKIQDELEVVQDALHSRDRKLKELRDDLIMKNEEIDEQHTEIERLKKLVAAYVHLGRQKDIELEHTHIEMERLSQEMESLKLRHAAFVSQQKEEHEAILIVDSSEAT